MPRQCRTFLCTLGRFKKKEGPARPLSVHTVRVGVKALEHPGGFIWPTFLKELRHWSLAPWKLPLSLWELH